MWHWLAIRRHGVATAIGIVPPHIKMRHCSSTAIPSLSGIHAFNTPENENKQLSSREEKKSLRFVRVSPIFHCNKIVGVTYVWTFLLPFNPFTTHFPRMHAKLVLIYVL